jgi:hypothetical protein
MIRCFLLDGALMGRCNAEAVVIMGWMTCWVMVGEIVGALAIGAIAVMNAVKRSEAFLNVVLGADRGDLRYNLGYRRFWTLKTKYIRASGWPTFHNG